MIGLDTNVLVRYFTQDDPHQSPHATEILERRLTVTNPGFVTLAVMIETVWVLRRRHRLDRIALADVIERMLEAAELVVECEQDVYTAMASMRDGHASFADALLLSRGQRAGCSAVLTFDKRALRIAGFAPA